MRGSTSASAAISARQRASHCTYAAAAAPSPTIIPPIQQRQPHPRLRTLVTSLARPPAPPTPARAFHSPVTLFRSSGGPLLALSAPRTHVPSAPPAHTATRYPSCVPAGGAHATTAHSASRSLDLFLSRVFCCA